MSTDSESSQQVHSEHLAEGTDHGHSGGHGPKVGMGALALGALGIVYGDIGTSPRLRQDIIQITKTETDHGKCLLINNS